MTYAMAIVIADNDPQFADFLADMDSLMSECDAIAEEFSEEVETLIAAFPVIGIIERHPDFIPVSAGGWIGEKSPNASSENLERFRVNS